MPREDIEFKGFDGTILRGWFFKPENASSTSKLPCLILSHGFGCVKEMGLDEVANILTSQLPITCLVYDHRGFGSSDTAPGQPRQEFIVSLQTLDMREAITWAQLREEVNSDKIGLWGYSSSGGQVLQLAGSDRRVKAVITVAPLIDGFQVATRLGGGHNFIANLPILEMDRLNRAKGEPPIKIPIVSEDPNQNCLLPSRESWTFFSAAMEKGFKNEATLRSVESILSNVLDDRLIQYISPRPVLWVVNTMDTNQHWDHILPAYTACWEPKELLTLEGSHYDAFGKYLEKFMSKQIEFLKKNLCA